MSEKTPTRFNQHEQAAEAALNENARLATIEARRSSPEVAVLNDHAELEIWGSGDRTYTNPETGDIIASPDKPMAGLLDTFAKTRPGPEAKALAERYETDIHQLMENDDLELCQAKMVMDMRMSDEQEGMPSLTTEFMKSDGLSASEAEDKAKSIYSRKDAKRLELIKDNGIFSPEEYDQLKNGNQADTADTTGEATPGDDETSPETDEAGEEQQDPEAEKLQERMDTTRDEYARLLAGASATVRGVKGGKRAEALESARQAWLEAAKEITQYGQEIVLGKFNNLSDAEIEELKKTQTAKALIQEHYLLEVKKYEHAEAIAEHGPKGFLRLWRENSELSKGSRRIRTAGKIGLVAGAGLAAGLIMPIVPGLAGAAALGARSHAKRFDRLTLKVGEDADATNRELDYRMREKGGDFSFDDVALLTEETTHSRVSKNRTKMAGSLAAGAALGFIGSQVIDGVTGNGEAAPVDDVYSDTEPSPGDYHHPVEEPIISEEVETGEPNDEAPTDDAEADDDAEAEFTPEELEVTVENGDGFTHLLNREFGLDGHDSYRLYLDLVENVGGDNLLEGVGTYMENGEYRLSNPGDAEWTPEARQFIEEWIQSQSEA